MPEIGTSGLTSGDGKRGDGHRPQATAPILDSTWLRENVRGRKARRIVFSIVLSRQPSPALLFFKLIELETKFPSANSISAFLRSQDPKATSQRAKWRNPIDRRSAVVRHWRSPGLDGRG
jgi:hypothetical protein